MTVQSKYSQDRYYQLNLSSTNKAVVSNDKQNKKNPNNLSDHHSIKASELNSNSIKAKRGEKVSQSDSIAKQIEDINKQIENIQQSNQDKVSKDDKIKQLQEKIKELQKQLAQAKLDEAKQKQEEAKESKNDNVTVTDAQKEDASKKAEANAMANLIEASSELKASKAPIASAERLLTKSDLGQGSKYNGNLTPSQHQEILSQATKYLSYAKGNLNNALELSKKAGDSISEYNKHSKKTKSTEETKNGEKSSVTDAEITDTSVYDPLSKTIATYV